MGLMTDFIKRNPIWSFLIINLFNAAANVVFDFFSETDNFSVLITSYVLNILLVGIIGYLLIKRAR